MFQQYWSYYDYVCSSEIYQSLFKKYFLYYLVMMLTFSTPLLAYQVMFGVWIALIRDKWWRFSVLTALTIGLTINREHPVLYLPILLTELAEFFFRVGLPRIFRLLARCPKDPVFQTALAKLWTRLRSDPTMDNGHGRYLSQFFNDLASDDGSQAIPEIWWKEIRAIMSSPSSWHFLRNGSDMLAVFPSVTLVVNSKIYVHPINVQIVENKDPDEDCPVCRDTLPRYVLKTSCGHSYCPSCLLNWTLKHKTCPLCRQHFGFGLYVDNFIPASIPSDSGVPIVIENFVIEREVVEAVLQPLMRLENYAHESEDDSDEDISADEPILQEGAPPQVDAVVPDEVPDEEETVDFNQPD